MIELKAPKNLLNLLQPEIFGAVRTKIEVSLDHPSVRDDSFVAYHFRVDGSIHAYSDKPAKHGCISQHVRIFADSSIISCCRSGLISDCLEQGYLMAEEDSIVVKVVANQNLRFYEVLRASPKGVLVDQGPYEGWNLLSSEKVEKIKSLCLE